LPDHADLLASAVAWAAGDGMPLRIEGPGLLDCHLYARPGRLILHVVNLSGAGAWRPPIHELIPVGPLTIRLRLPEGGAGQRVRLLVAGAEAPARIPRG